MCIIISNKKIITTTVKYNTEIIVLTSTNACRQDGIVKITQILK